MSEKILKAETLAAALAGISAAGGIGSVSEGVALAMEAKGTVKCFGIQEKGQNGCAVSPKQIQAANKHFNNKYGETKPISCHGNATASDSEGFLAWVGVDTEEACFSKKGFLIKGSNVVASGTATESHQKDSSKHSNQATEDQQKE
jgi:uncharacterized membrane protein